LSLGDWYPTSLDTAGSGLPTSQGVVITLL